MGPGGGRGCMEAGQEVIWGSDPQMEIKHNQTPQWINFLSIETLEFFRWGTKTLGEGSEKVLIGLKIPENPAEDVLTSC